MEAFRLVAVKWSLVTKKANLTFQLGGACLVGRVEPICIHPSNTRKCAQQWLVFAKDTHGHSWRPAYEIVVALGKTTLLIMRKAYFRVMNPYHGGTPGYRLYRRDGENQIVVPVKMLSLFSLETLQRNRRRWFRTLKLENMSSLRKRAVQFTGVLKFNGRSQRWLWTILFIESCKILQL